MSHKDKKIAALVEPLQGRALDAHYLAFFECFNRAWYFEAHEVLEALWLPQRGGPDDLFYKGLIQLAGAFVHFQKRRLQPAAALLNLARRNLGRYPAVYASLDVAHLVLRIEKWLVLAQASANPLTGAASPRLTLAHGVDPGSCPANE